MRVYVVRGVSVPIPKHCVFWFFWFFWFFWSGATMRAQTIRLTGFLAEWCSRSHGCPKPEKPENQKNTGFWEAAR